LLLSSISLLIDTLPEEFSFVCNNLDDTNRNSLSHLIQAINCITPHSNVWDNTMNGIRMLLNSAFEENNDLEINIFMRRLSLTGINERIMLSNALIAPRNIQSGSSSSSSSLTGLTRRTFDSGGNENARVSSVPVDTIGITNRALDSVAGLAQSSLTQTTDTPRVITNVPIALTSSFCEDSMPAGENQKDNA
jgi:hypothetical protein